MESNRRVIGANYEKAAGKYLESIGYEVLEYNYRCPKGEIDIVAKEGEYLVFCEVKFRKGLKRGGPLDAVTAAKQRRISHSAEYYLMERGLLYLPCRFDVIGITGDGRDIAKSELELIKNAFDYIQ